MNIVRHQTPSRSSRTRTFSSVVVLLVLLGVLGHSVMMAADVHAVASDHRTRLTSTLQPEFISATELIPSHQTGSCFATSDATFEGGHWSKQPDVHYANCLPTIELQVFSSSVTANILPRGPGPPDDILALFQILRL